MNWRTDTVVSRHHTWAGPASYAPEDRDVVLCMECGVRCKVGHWRKAPRCNAKVERRSSGYGGLTLNNYFARHRRNPAAYPLPRNLLVFGEPA
jgi:hypothetical protein